MNDILELFDFIDGIHDMNDINDEAVRIPRRYIRNMEDPFEKFNDDQFFRRYRFPKNVVLNEIMGLLSIENTSNRGLPLPPILKLLCALQFYAASDFQIVAGDLRGIHQTTVSRIIKNVSNDIAGKFKNYVKFPETNEQWENVKQRFYEIAQMPGVGGCIDCTHVKIQNPGGLHGEVFRNRKGWFSLNIQVVCGPSMEMFDVVVRWPGSYHNSFIFNASHVCAVFSQNNNGLLLLGDNGYACKPYLFTPLLNPVTEAEVKFNKAQIKTRNIIERVFGVWKRKFPCLRRGLANSQQTTVYIIIACAVLYNISVKLRLPHIFDNNEIVNYENEIPMNNLNREIIGCAARRSYIIRHLN